eukprot:TRINITY_DN2499_c0_g1_i4.p1 TRINITY_DN2499_c0_g1~~TRINITY_DN2499_c0_g1_i4.p1  ORF type:complete len:435 (+),score=59.56 TRINITY_DN2499_c0_g1_i4:3-1307(+)
MLDKMLRVFSEFNRNYTSIFSLRNKRIFPSLNLLLSYVDIERSHIEVFSDAVVAFHPDLEKQKKYMLPYKVGEITPEHRQVKPLVQDFRKLRQKLVDEGYFKSEPVFYALNVLQIVVLELIAAWAAFNLNGGIASSWFTWILCAFILATSQIQAGWLQHDFGHLSVFNELEKKRSNLWETNSYWHYITISLLKGASSRWWRFRHNRHHSKPNIINKDPDLKNEPLFIFGKSMVEAGRSSSLTPYQEQYWWFLGPPMVTSVFFVLTNYYYTLKWKVVDDFVWAHSYFARTWIFYYFAAGSWISMFKFYFFMRIIESMWFTWITAMNHFPCDISYDGEYDWVTGQCRASQNFMSTYFNNWFTGHLSHQIEHHLFPTMPRHNYPKVAPIIREFCSKHNIVYKEKTLYQAAKEVVLSLREAAQECVSMTALNEKAKKP